MSRKTFIIIVTVLILIGLLILGFFLYRNAQRNNGGEPVTLRDLFPFGPGTGGSNNQQGGQTGGQQGGEQPQGGQAIPRLRKVSTDPVIGYTTMLKRVPVDPNSVPAPKQETITTTYNFETTLKSGDKGVAVTELQKVLNKCPATQIAKAGTGSPGKEGSTYGPATVQAVTVFQELFADEILKPQELSKGTGVFDELTKKKLTAGFVCTFPVELPDTILKDVVRYVVQGTSNIFDAFADTLQSTRLSDTTIPRTKEAFFANNGQAVFLRSLQADNQTIDTLLGTISEPVVGGDGLPELVVSSMPKNIVDLSISPDGKQILFLLPAGNILNGFISDIDGKNQKKVFSSQFFGWLSQWATPTKAVFTVKATGYATGYAYSTDITKGDFTKIAGPITALTTLMSPDGKYLLLSKNTTTGPALALQNMATKQTRSLGIQTLPEKCTWAKNSVFIYCAVPNAIAAGNVYPDDWYQGTIGFSDSFWQIDITGTYENQILFTPLGEGGESTDGVRLMVDEKGQYLYFLNRDTDILWQYNLSPEPVTVI